MRFAALGVALVFGIASASDPLAQEVGTFVEPELATTHHQMTVNGVTLPYTARMGLLPIRHNDTGEIHGQFGFISYFADREPGQPARPVIFVWNGGPGANSSTVHFIGFGPRRLRTPDDPAHLQDVASELCDNDETWLTFADLVFVDPVGTGHGRPARTEYAAEFYSTLGDIASTAEFIRVFRTRFDLLDAPIFLAGESYGTWRASGAAEILLQRGVSVTGVLLISGGMAMGAAAPDSVRTALYVPSRAATAIYHQRLAPELQRDEVSTLRAAESWALEVYAPAWEQRETLGEERRDEIIAGLTKFTGIPAAKFDRKSLSMTSRQFTSSLLADREQTLGRYDMRVVRGAKETEQAGDYSARRDVLLKYFRHELAFRTDLAYQGLEDGWSPAGNLEAIGPAMNWVWNQGEAALTSGTDAAVQANQATVGSGDGPPGGSQPWMLRAMQRDPQLKLFVAAGQYDSLNSCALNAWIAKQLDPQIAANVTLGCYPAGHIMYDTATARAALRKDVEKFVRMALQ